MGIAALLLSFYVDEQFLYGLIADPRTHYALQRYLGHLVALLYGRYRVS